jgi:hypothetical protein
MILEVINTLNLEKASGIKLLCTILYIFFYDKFPDLEISLEADNVEVFNKFYKKLGFTKKKSTSLSCFMKGITDLIHNKCIYCSQDVKLIILNDNEYIEEIEDMKALIK